LFHCTDFLVVKREEILVTIHKHDAQQHHVFMVAKTLAFKNQTSKKI
jgi:hypothetical protein